MKRSHTDFLSGQNASEEDEVVKKMTRSCEDIRNQCRHATSLEECVADLLKGVDLPQKCEGDANNLTDFIKASDFWEDVLQMGMEVGFPFF